MDNLTQKQIRALLIALIFPALLYLSQFFTYFVSEIFVSLLSGSSMAYGPELIVSLTIIANVFSIVLVASLYKIRNVSFTGLINLKKPHASDIWLIVLTGVSLSVVITSVYALLPSGLTQGNADSNSIIMSSGAVLTFALVGVAAPVTEEILFRGLCFTYLKRAMALWPAIIVQGILFAFVHDSWLNMPGILGASVVAALLVEWCGGVIPAILEHAAYNITILVLIYSGFDPPMSSMPIYLIIGAALLAFCMWRLYQNHKARRNA